MLEKAEKQEVSQMIDIGPLSEVIKRDGEKRTFDAGKIVSAIAKAGMATGEFGEDEATLLAGQVIKVLKHRFAGAVVPTIEQIQDVVEQVLISPTITKPLVLTLCIVNNANVNAKIKRLPLTPFLLLMNIWIGRIGVLMPTQIKDILWAD